MKLALLVFLIALLVSAALLPIFYVYNQTENEGSSEKFFFGVMFGSNSTMEAKLLIDRVKDYVNLFVLGSWDININETSLNEVCNYAVDAGMSIIAYFDFLPIGTFPWLTTWLETTQERWGEKFLGIYLHDEPGGNQIDSNQWQPGESARIAMANATDYSDAANKFVTSIPNSFSWQNLKNINPDLPIVTSDYALYWFDYLAGYDTIFVELGWNASTTQQIALCRGAADVQGKDWGAIITWTYSEPPYIASDLEIYHEMVTAYSAGADYVIVFDFPKNPEDNVYGILEDKHFKAMELFWEYTQTFPRENYGQIDGEVALVLPKDYGWGTRRTANFVEDRIWGFWPEDEKILMIGQNMKKLLNMYGLKLDIIYDDPQFNYAEKYSKIYLWNSTIS
ncbi:hypothetical protein JW988_01725 [Candidatus Bathyarchaeota archaeon]|nr:hypothetical protein [Candidatus Bathyarchaeota archaeon]